MDKQFHFEKPTKRLAFLIMKDIKLHFMYGHHQKAVELIQLFMKNHYSVALRKQKLILFYAMEWLFDMDKIDLIQSILEKSHYEKLCVMNAIKENRFEYMTRYMEKSLKTKKDITNTIMVIYIFEYIYESVPEAERKQYEEGKCIIGYNFND